MAGPTQLNPTEQDALVKQIGLALLRAAPTDWASIEVSFRAIGRYTEVHGQVVFPDDTTADLPVAPEIGALFARLRAGMYREGRGTWFNARYQLDRPAAYNLEYDRDEPRWQNQPPPPAFFDELRMFPREDENVPEWLTRTLAALQPPFRTARLFDGMGPAGPVLNRPPVDGEERERVQHYLDAAPLALPARGYDTDLFDEERRQTVPIAFHTDGVWIWPAAVNFYLRTHGVPPDPELVAHIRRAEFHMPEVDEQARTAAAAFIAGPRRPPVRPPDMAQPEQPAEGEPAAPTFDHPERVPAESAQDEPNVPDPVTVDEPLPPVTPAAEVVERLRARLDELGVPESAYTVGTPSGPAWTMEQTGEGWRVGWFDGHYVAPAVFADAGDAAAFLAGKLILETAPASSPGPSTVSAPLAELEDDDDDSYDRRRPLPPSRPLQSSPSGDDLFRPARPVGDGLFEPRQFDDDDEDYRPGRFSQFARRDSETPEPGAAKHSRAQDEPFTPPTEPPPHEQLFTHGGAAPQTFTAPEAPAEEADAATPQSDERQLPPTDSPEFAREDELAADERFDGGAQFDEPFAASRSTGSGEQDTPTGPGESEAHDQSAPGQPGEHEGQDQLAPGQSGEDSLFAPRQQAEDDAFAPTGQPGEHDFAASGAPGQPIGPDDHAQFVPPADAGGQRFGEADNQFAPPHASDAAGHRFAPGEQEGQEQLSSQPPFAGGEPGGQFGQAPESGGQFDHPEPGHFDHAEPGQFGKAEQGQFHQPEPSQFDQVPGQFDQAGRGQFGQAEPAQFGQAEPGRLGQDEPSQLRQAEPGQFGQAEPAQFGQAEPGQFGQAEPAQFGQGEPGQFGQGEPGQFGQGEPGQFGQGEPGQFGQGEPGQFGQGEPVGQFAQAGEPGGQFGHGGPGAQFGRPGELGGPFNQAGEGAGPFGQQPAGHFNQPGEPAGPFGQAGEPAGQFGQAGEPVGQFGQTGEPGRQFGHQGEPVGQFGQAGEPGAQFGHPGEAGGQFAPPGEAGGQFNQAGERFGQAGEPSGQFGRPGEPVGPFGQPGEPVGPFGQEPGRQFGHPGEPGAQFGQPGEPVGQFGQAGESGRPFGHAGEAAAHGQAGEPGRQFGHPGEAGHFAQPAEPGGQAAPAGDSVGQFAQAGEPVGQFAQAGEPGGQFAQPGEPVGQFAQAGGQFAHPGEPMGQFAQAGEQVAQPGEHGGQFGQPGDHGGQFAQPGEHGGQFAQPGDHGGQFGQPGERGGQFVPSGEPVGQFATAGGQPFGAGQQELGVQQGRRDEQGRAFGEGGPGQFVPRGPERAQSAEQMAQQAGEGGRPRRPQDWPIQPLRGEPPLTLFRGKQLIQLPEGTELDRYGDPSGNLTYAVGTPFDRRSLVPDWINRPYRAYRVVRATEALTGAAIPWFDQPGGGTAYVLPQSIAELVSNGVLEEIPDRQPPARA
ncbi:glycohydrolase toxin TNT-related protein [Actinokineospora sp. UTMC 2448]|uniref:glycohydrolase toxin TNT-related protein n=1 Tax=Actinokineospora sp. UTMC 2448 TaxID=2268449 RepID=UPI002207E5E8|nr:glycohydrolase toxin TNT-related protein [Actinokineospora sp. UTMC 2448]UVS82046.1 hypothetical protein Actkin_05811 [Actinokineospora sp. UTMC 2448]